MTDFSDLTIGELVDKHEELTDTFEAEQLEFLTVKAKFRKTQELLSKFRALYGSILKEAAKLKAAKPEPDQTETVEVES